MRTTACAMFPPISWADEDTAETKAAVKEHNAVWAKVCPAAKAGPS